MENKTYTSTPNLYFSPPKMYSPHEAHGLMTFYLSPLFNHKFHEYFGPDNT